MLSVNNIKERDNVTVIMHAWRGEEKQILREACIHALQVRIQVLTSLLPSNIVHSIVLVAKVTRM